MGMVYKRHLIKILLMSVFALTLTVSAHVPMSQILTKDTHNHAYDTTHIKFRPKINERGIADPSQKMSTSLYPIEMKVNRHSVRIYSENNQMLPIYKQNGTFYMAMRLNKGVNWLNGLPNGRYFINNTPITIQ